MAGILPAALLVYALVLSALFGGVSAGMMAGVAPDHAFTICAPSGQPGADAPAGPKGHDCPCGIVCLSGAAGLAVAAAAGVLPLPARVAAFTPSAPRIGSRRIDRGLASEARGPPPISA